MASSRTPSDPDVVRRRLRVEGLVQGVGFRPFVYSLAQALGLSGSVRNEPGGVTLEVQGPAVVVAEFEHRLQSEAPVLAVIDALHGELLTPLPACAGFTIEPSAAASEVPTVVAPDVATCADCLAELKDPADRRFRYPFVNCTACGPRFTIVIALPYDRPYTTMRGFPLCAECAREYHDPADRRFHAQPVACPRCGPTLWLQAAHDPPWQPSTAPRRGETALREACAALAHGSIVALKGLGGFHLACDATDEQAVQRLRLRKGRAEKPLALMVANLEQARRYAQVDPDEARLLEGRERPIVLLRRRTPPVGAPVAQAVAPGQAHLGVLLPYTPLHTLLLDALDPPRPLVMTSGNRSDEPIARDNNEALERLGGLADLFLLHDRPIHVVCDDSLVRVFEGRELPLRRSRGYAPFPVRLPSAGPPLLAVGGELKTTFCLTHSGRAFLSQHLGDMGQLETQAAFERALAHFLGLFRVTPQAVACDLHPDYHSTRWAESFAARHGVPLVRVQHHQAHLAALMAEHGLGPEASVLGVTFDGAGYGLDGSIWGGEWLLARGGRSERVARLRPVLQPGGDTAVRHPARMALAHLAAADIPWDDTLACVAAVPEEQRRVLQRQLASGVGCVPASSAGRLFDAAAALVGLRATASYEGQAAMELEAVADDEPCDKPYGGTWTEIPSGGAATPGLLELDPAPLWRTLVADSRAGVPVSLLAARFHDGLAADVIAGCRRLRTLHAVQTVGLSGGVFQNLRLLRTCVAGLRAAGFEVLVHQRVPPNDGGLALGQAALASEHLARGAVPPEPLSG